MFAALSMLLATSKGLAGDDPTQGSSVVDARTHGQCKGAVPLRCEPGLAVPTALHPAPAAVPCTACGRRMQLKHARRTGHAFYGCSGFSRYGCRFVRQSRHASPSEYRVEVAAEMETVGSFRLMSRPPTALAGILQKVGLFDRNGTARSVGGISWHPREDGQEGAVFPLLKYEKVRRQLAQCPWVKWEGIPAPTLRAFSLPPEAAAAHERGIRPLPRSMLESLCTYQKEGIDFVVAKQGRALIADEMGLGKSVQALGAAVVLGGWPLLIVCPASMRLVWAEECERWLNEVPHVIFSSADKPTPATPSVVIVSFKVIS